MFDIIVWLNKPRILSVFLKKNARSYKNVKMLQLLTNTHNFQSSHFNYKTQSTYLIGIS